MSEGTSDTIVSYFDESARVLKVTGETCSTAILDASREIAEAARAGGKILLCGNGGSAADAQHCAAELTSRLTKEFERPAIAALALTTDTSFLTAYANDYDFAGVFARQIEALGRAGDVLILISTTGNSENLCRAAAAAKDRGIRSVGLLGGDGGRLRPQVDHAIVVPSGRTGNVQEAHAAIIHVVCSLVERSLFSPANGGGRVG
jgi:D-sedoheptulose 7-phosphate isomerase